jgi:hypothetical protein
MAVLPKGKQAKNIALVPPRPVLRAQHAGSSDEDPLADPSVVTGSGSEEHEQATTGSLVSAGSPGGHVGMTGKLCSSVQALILAPIILPLT